VIPNAKLILGPPGCGKTYRLIQEIKSALEVGTHPSRIGVISFTKKAIEEMIARSCAAVNLEATDFPHMRTSHSFGFNGLGLQAQDVMKTSDYQVIGAELGLDFEGKDSASVDDGIMLPSIGGIGFPVFTDGYTGAVQDDYFGSGVQPVWKPQSVLS
jgi:superfamily I DNA/RNA helicase